MRAGHNAGILRFPASGGLLWACGRCIASRLSATMETMRKAVAAGTLISLVCFALVFWAVSRLLALLPRLETSPWFQPATNGIVLLAIATGSLICLRKRRRKTNAARR